MKSKFGDHSRGWPEGVQEGATPFPGLLHFTLDLYLIMLSVKQDSIKYLFFESLVWLDLGLKPGLLGHWRTLQPLGQCPVLNDRYGWWLILFSLDHFSRQHKNGESLPNTLFLRTFWTGWTHFLSTPCKAAEAQHHEDSCLIYGPLESTLLDQGFPVEHELDAWNQPHTETPYVASNFCYLDSDAQFHTGIQLHHSCQ